MMKGKRILSALLALVMLLTVFVLPYPETAEAKTDEETKAELNEKLKQAQENISELNEQLADAKAEKKDAQEQKFIVDQQTEALQSEIDVVNQQITATETQITETEEDIAEQEKLIEETKASEQQQYAIFCQQVRDEEERGKISYWSVLFKAKSFSDLLSRIDFINEIVEHDQNVIAKLEAVQETLAGYIEDLETKKSDLEDQKTELESEKSTLKSAKAELDEKVAEADAILSEINSNISDLQAMVKAEESAAKEAQKQIDALASKGSGAVGGLIWPTSVTRWITSRFGSRSSPGGIGTTNHKGVDIGAYYGSNILAAKAGTVILAGWNGGFGYCVIIDHGDGLTTLYGHMSSIKVSKGETVTQGQVIGLVGSTGNSTGPHIHYGIYSNGTPIDPLPYLPGYILYGDA